VFAAPSAVLRGFGWSSLHLGVSSGDGSSWSCQDLQGLVALLALESAGELEVSVLQQENIIAVKVHPKRLKLR